MKRWAAIPFGIGALIVVFNYLVLTHPAFGYALVSYYDDLMTPLMAELAFDLVPVLPIALGVGVGLLLPMHFGDNRLFGKVVVACVAAFITLVCGFILVDILTTELNVVAQIHRWIIGLMRGDFFGLICLGLVGLIAGASFLRTGEIHSDRL